MPLLPQAKNRAELEIDIENDETEGTSYKPLIDFLNDATKRDEVTEELGRVHTNDM